MTDSSTAVEALLSGLSTIRDWQEDFYRDLHAHPELSHQEYETARKVAARLRIGAMTSATESAAPWVLTQKGPGSRIMSLTWALTGGAAGNRTRFGALVPEPNRH